MGIKSFTIHNKLMLHRVKASVAFILDANCQLALDKNPLFGTAQAQRPTNVGHINILGDTHSRDIEDSFMAVTRPGAEKKPNIQLEHSVSNKAVRILFHAFTQEGSEF